MCVSVCHVSNPTINSNTLRLLSLTKLNKSKQIPSYPPPSIPPSVRKPMKFINQHFTSRKTINKTQVAGRIFLHKLISTQEQHPCQHINQTLSTSSWWLNRPWKICSSNWISLGFGVKIKLFSNHHPVISRVITLRPYKWATGIFSPL